MLKTVKGSLRTAQTKLLLSPTIKHFLKRKGTCPAPHLESKLIMACLV